MLRVTTARQIEDSFVRIFTLFVAFVGAFTTSKAASIFIAGKNSDAIQNPYVTSSFKPELNFARIIWIVLASLLLYKLLTYVLENRPRLFKLLFVLFIVLSVFAIDIVPKLDSYVGHLDTFHNGEQLSPASEFNASKGLFSDMFVLHGAGEDVLVPSFALHASNVISKGTGISFYYLITSLLELGATALFVYLLSLLFTRTSIWMAVSLWFTFGVYSQFSYVRDLFTWGVLALIFYVLFKAQDRSKQIAFIGLGALSSTALIYAIDRGLLVCIMTALLGGALLFSEHLENGDFKIRLPRKLADFLPAIYSAGGAVIVQIILLLSVGLTAYKNFLVTYFIQIPKYDGLLFNFPLPDLSLSSFPTWLPVMLAPISLIMVYQLFKLKPGGMFSAQLLLAVILSVSGLLFLRTGYGRPDWGHIAYATPLLFVSIFYVTQLYVTKLLKLPGALWLPILVIGLLFIPVSSLDHNRFFTLMNTRPASVKRFVSLPTTKDREWIAPNVKQVSEYIDSHTKPSDPLFVFTQQPIYYYLTQRHNPSRFYVPWLTDPTPLERELLTSLKKHPPKYIVYLGRDGWDSTDGLSMAERDPNVNAWILKNYPSSATVGQATILSK